MHVDIVKTDECAFVVDCLVCVHFSTYVCTYLVCFALCVCDHSQAANRTTYTHVHEP